MVSLDQQQSELLLSDVYVGYDKEGAKFGILPSWPLLQEFGLDSLEITCRSNNL